MINKINIVFKTHNADNFQYKLYETADIYRYFLYEKLRHCWIISFSAIAVRNVYLAARLGALEVV